MELCEKKRKAIFTIHRLAVVHPSAVIGGGTVIGPGVVVGEGVIIGEDYHIYANSVLEGGIRIGNRNKVGPMASLGTVCPETAPKIIGTPFH